MQKIGQEISYESVRNIKYHASAGVSDETPVNGNISIDKHCLHSI